MRRINHKFKESLENNDSSTTTDTLAAIGRLLKEKKHVPYNIKDCDLIKDYLLKIISSNPDKVAIATGYLRRLCYRVLSNIQEYLQEPNLQKADLKNRANLYLSWLLENTLPYHYKAFSKNIEKYSRAINNIRTEENDQDAGVSNQSGNNNNNIANNNNNNNVDQQFSAIHEGVSMRFREAGVNNDTFCAIRNDMDAFINQDTSYKEYLLQLPAEYRDANAEKLRREFITRYATANNKNLCIWAGNIGVQGGAQLVLLDQIGSMSYDSIHLYQKNNNYALLINETPSQEMGIIIYIGSLKQQLMQSHQDILSLRTYVVNLCRQLSMYQQQHHQIPVNYNALSLSSYMYPYSNSNNQSRVSPNLSNNMSAEPADKPSANTENRLHM